MKLFSVQTGNIIEDQNLTNRDEAKECKTKDRFSVSRVFNGWEVDSKIPSVRPSQLRSTEKEDMLHHICLMLMLDPKCLHLDGDKSIGSH